MLDATLSTLGAAAVSAIVFVAYRHPEAFSKLYSALKPSLRVALIGSAAWLVGDSEVRNDLRALLGKSPSMDETARSALRTIADHQSSAMWVLIVTAGVWIFLESLSALPRVGITDKPSSAPPATTAAPKPSVPPEQQPPTPT